MQEEGISQPQSPSKDTKELESNKSIFLNEPTSCSRSKDCPNPSIRTVWNHTVVPTCKKVLFANTRGAPSHALRSLCRGLSTASVLFFSSDRGSAHRHLTVTPSTITRQFIAILCFCSAPWAIRCLAMLHFRI